MGLEHGSVNVLSRGMRAWIVAIALVAACKGGKDKDTATTPKAAGAAVPTVSVATVLAKEDDKPPLLVLIDDAGTVRLAAAKTWGEVDENSLTVTNKAMPLDTADEYALEVYAGRDRFEMIRAWNEATEIEPPFGDRRRHRADQDDPPPPPPEDMPDDESGGTGTAMALDEGKMGKKDSDRAEGQYKMKNENVDPQLARQQAIEQARKAGFFRPLGTDHHPNADGTPSRGADISGVVVKDGKLEKVRAMVVIAPTAKASKLIAAIRETNGAIAVSYNGKVRPLHLQFETRDATEPASSPSWIEARVSAKSIAVEAVPDKPLEVADLAQLGATIDKARASRDLARDAVDVLVDADVDAQRLVDVIVALDTSGVNVISMGGALSPEELARRGHRMPTLAFGQPNAQGDLDKQDIRAVIRGAKDKIQACYEKALQTSPNLKGTVQAQFFIKPDGGVASVTASGVSPDVAVCVAGVIESLTFPKPKGGGGVQVNYPFTMRT